MNKNKKQHLINREIRATQVRVIDNGVMSFNDAIKLAESKSEDLVLLNDKVSPIICKIMNYEKFLYALNKKPKQKVLEMKEIKLGANTSDNDLNYRIVHIKDFLEKGHKVRLTLQFKGREMIHIDKGKENMLKMIVAVENYGVPESLPVMEGKKMFVTIRPKTSK